MSNNNYWVTVYQDKNSGLFCAKKVYETNSGVPYMWGCCAVEVVNKLIEDGEDENNIHIFDESKIANME